MTVYVEPLFHSTPEGRLTLRYRCSCGHVTDTSTLDEDHGDRAHSGMREHLADAHGRDVDAGRCNECGTVTDYFRAHVPDLGTDVWLCQRHAPAIPVIVDQGEQEEQPCEP